MCGPLVLKSEADLYTVLKKLAESQLVIAIDGLCGVGKSSLSQRIGKTLDFAVIECDSFITPSRQFYPSILDRDGLIRAIATARERKRPLIIEGILIRLVLEELGIMNSYHVYVRRDDAYSSVGSAGFFDDSQAEEVVVARITDVARLLGIADDEPLLDRELARYHKQRLPHKHADILYQVLTWRDSHR